MNYPEQHILREVQGKGVRCSVIPLDGERVYWWATERITRNSEFSPKERKSRLLATFAGWEFGISTAIEATPEDEILQNDLHDRPALPKWSKGRAILIGDAAHPTTPNLGQGACLAIEDAVAIGYFLSSFESEEFSAAFSAFEKERKVSLPLFDEVFRRGKISNGMFQACRGLPPEHRCSQPDPWSKP